MIAAPGDFKIENNTIVLLHRAFPFPDTRKRNGFFACVLKTTKLAVIEDLINVKAIDEFRLAPMLIAILQSDKKNVLQFPCSNTRAYSLMPYY